MTRPPARPRHTAAPPAASPLPRPGPALAAAALALLLAALGSAPAQGAEAAPDKFAGTYRIEGWQRLEARGLYHFFYLHPAGKFLLGGEWPGVETSRAAGRWYVTGDRLYLEGRARVETNQGNWQVPFRRTFVIRVGGRGFHLRPVPQKNRYGLLGWPDAWVYFRGQPAPNLPSGNLPATAAGVLERIAQLEDALQ